VPQSLFATQYGDFGQFLAEHQIRK